jgi:cell division protein FtsW (lipid II flippase)
LSTSVRNQTAQDVLQKLWDGLTRCIDSFLLSVALAIVAIGLITLFSATDQSVTRISSQLTSLAFSLVLMWLVANVSPQTLARAAVPLYTLAVVMLIGVALFGTLVNGSRRWLNLGVGRFQPSELMKIALPLMLAWYFQKFEGRIGWKDFAIAATLIVVPVWLIKRQPDLGTALMIGASGFYVLYLAGLSWKVIVGLGAVGAGSGAAGVAAPARLSARAHSHVHRSVARSAGRRLPLIAGDDRARFRWCRRQGMVERDANPSRFSARAPYRLHLRRLR